MSFGGFNGAVSSEEEDSLISLRGFFRIRSSVLMWVFGPCHFNFDKEVKSGLDQVVSELLCCDMEAGTCRSHLIVIIRIPLRLFVTPLLIKIR